MHEITEHPERILGLLTRTFDGRPFTTKTRDDYAGDVRTVEPESALGIRELHSTHLAHGLAYLPAETTYRDIVGATVHPIPH